LDPDVEAVVMRTLAFHPADRPTAGNVVRTLERAQARLAAVARRRGERSDVSVSAWQVAAAGLGLAVLGLWTRLHRHGDKEG
jgi:hypothetical protein